MNSIFVDFCGDALTPPDLRSVVVNRDRSVLIRSVPEWTVILNTIAVKAPGRVIMRDTDHEYRVDTRNIISVDGQKLPCEISVDGLPYNMKPSGTQMGDEILINKLLDIYFECADK